MSDRQWGSLLGTRRSFQVRRDQHIGVVSEHSTNSDGELPAKRIRVMDSKKANYTAPSPQQTSYTNASPSMHAIRPRLSLQEQRDLNVDTSKRHLPTSVPYTGIAHPLPPASCASTMTYESLPLVQHMPSSTLSSDKAMNPVSPPPVIGSALSMSPAYRIDAFALPGGRCSADVGCYEALTLNTSASRRSESELVSSLNNWLLVHHQPHQQVRSYGLNNIPINTDISPSSLPPLQFSSVACLWLWLARLLCLTNSVHTTPLEATPMLSNPPKTHTLPSRSSPSIQATPSVPPPPSVSFSFSSINHVVTRSHPGPFGPSLDLTQRPSSLPPLGGRPSFMRSSSVSSSSLPSSPQSTPCSTSSSSPLPASSSLTESTRTDFLIVLSIVPSQYLVRLILCLIVAHLLIAYSSRARESSDLTLGPLAAYLMLRRRLPHSSTQSPSRSEPILSSMSSAIPQTSSTADPTLKDCISDPSSLVHALPLVSIPDTSFPSFLDSLHTVASVTTLNGLRSFLSPSFLRFLSAADNMRAERVLTQHKLSIALANASNTNNANVLYPPSPTTPSTSTTSATKKGGSRPMADMTSDWLSPMSGLSVEVVSPVPLVIKYLRMPDPLSLHTLHHMNISIINTHRLSTPRFLFPSRQRDSYPSPFALTTLPSLSSPPTTSISSSSTSTTSEPPSGEDIPALPLYMDSAWLQSIQGTSSPPVPSLESRPSLCLCHIKTTTSSLSTADVSATHPTSLTIHLSSSQLHRIPGCPDSLREYIDLSRIVFGLCPLPPMPPHAALLSSPSSITSTSSSTSTSAPLSASLSRPTSTKPPPTSCPDIFSSLMPHQWTCLERIVSQGGRCLVADDMGLGKTRSAIAASLLYGNDWPVLVLAPASLVDQWATEFTKWTRRQSHPQLSPPPRVCSHCTAPNTEARRDISIHVVRGGGDEVVPDPLVASLYAGNLILGPINHEDTNPNIPQSRSEVGVTPPKMLDKYGRVDDGEDVDDTVCREWKCPNNQCQLLPENQSLLSHSLTAQLHPHRRFVTILSYDSCVSAHARTRAAGFGFVIADEAHLLKNAASHRCRAAAQVALQAKRCLLLTGTPALNTPIDLFTLTHLVQPSLFPNRVRFASLYCASRPISELSLALRPMASSSPHAPDDTDGDSNDLGTQISWGSSRGQAAMCTRGSHRTLELHTILRRFIMVRRRKGEVTTVLPNHETSDRGVDEECTAIPTLVTLPPRIRKVRIVVVPRKETTNSSDALYANANPNRNDLPGPALLSVTQAASVMSSLDTAVSASEPHIISPISSFGDLDSSQVKNPTLPQRDDKIGSLKKKQHLMELLSSTGISKVRHALRAIADFLASNTLFAPADKSEGEVASNVSFTATQSPMDSKDQKEPPSITPGLLRQDTVPVDPPDKLLVFGHHKQVLDAIENGLRSQHNICPLSLSSTSSPSSSSPPSIPGEYMIRIDGSTAPTARQQLADRFQTDPRCRIALLSIQAAGTGLTLTAARSVLFTELIWTPSLLLQCEDRVHRITQTRPCHILYLVAANTLDELIWPLLQRKLYMASATVDGSDETIDAENDSHSSLLAHDSVLERFITSSNPPSSVI